MYVCLCRSITDTQIRQAVSQGARCNKDLHQHVGKPPECGRCCKLSAEIIRNTLGTLGMCEAAKATC